MSLDVVYSRKPAGKIKKVFTGGVGLKAEIFHEGVLIEYWRFFVRDDMSVDTEVSESDAIYVMR